MSILRFKNNDPVSNLDIEDFQSRKLSIENSTLVQTASFLTLSLLYSKASLIKQRISRILSLSPRLFSEGVDVTYGDIRDDLLRDGFDVVKDAIPQE